VKKNQREINNPANPQLLEKILPEQLKPELVRRLPLDFLKKQLIIPIIRENGQVVIALADALNLEAYDAVANILTRTLTEIEGLSQSELVFPRLICPACEIEAAISRCYYQTTNADVDEQNTQSFQSEENDISSETTAQTHAEDLLSITNKAPLVKLVNKIFFQAVHSRASDIHIEPFETEARVRFRIDGVLHDVFSIHNNQVAALVSRLKIMANLNIAEKRLPQDGQSRIKIGNNLVDVRVSVIPTLCGERITLRLLETNSERIGLERIGFSPDLLRRFRQLIRLTHGIILLTGPTGSGKTTTLYAAMNELNCDERNILTVEDPIEYQLPGIGQMQIKPKINLTFANCLRHILRQDPDVIMVGEIRDVETAEIAIQASLTGHLVLSTLHTNDSASAMTRLIDMGIEPYLISSSVVAVMAQRLVRIICTHCKQPHQPGEDILSAFSQQNREFLHQSTFYEGRGCEKCLETGYIGRTGIFELLIIEDDTKELILKQSSSHIIKKTAIRKGMMTLQQDGLNKAQAGQTTLKEVSRVTQDALESALEVSQNAFG